MARAAAARGTAMGLSSFASHPIEEVTAVNDKIFQICWLGTRKRSWPGLSGRVRRAPGPDRHDRLGVQHRPRLGQPGDPGRWTSKALIRLAPEVAGQTEVRLGLVQQRATWSSRSDRPQRLARQGLPGPTFFGATASG